MKDGHKFSLVITVKSQSESGTKTFRFHQNRIVIGSAHSCDLRLDGNSVSAIHAVIELQNASNNFHKQNKLNPTNSFDVVLYDLASETGTLIGTRPIVQEVIDPNDQVVIGNYLIQASLVGITQAAKTTAPSPTPKPVEMSDGANNAPTQLRSISLVVDAAEESAVVSSPNVLAKAVRSERPLEDTRPLLLEDTVSAIDLFQSSSERSLEVVSLYCGTITDVNHFRQKKIRFASKKNADLFAPKLQQYPDSGVDLLSSQNKTNDIYALNLIPEMTGLVSENGHLKNVSEYFTNGSSALKTIEINENSFAKINIKDLQLFIHIAPAPPKQIRSRLFENDPFFLKIMLSSLLFTIAALVGISRMVVEPRIEIEEIPERVATILYEPKKIEPPQPKPIPEPEKQPPAVAKVDLEKTLPTKKITENRAAPTPKSKTQPIARSARMSGQEGEGAKARGVEGRRGEANAPNRATPQSLAKRPGEAKTPTNKAQLNNGNSQVQGMGVVDLFKSDGGSLSKILAAGSGAQAGGDKLEGYSGFVSKGNQGLAAQGLGQGGGGESQGLGGLSVKGHGGGSKGTGLGALGSGGNMLGGSGKIMVDGSGIGEPVVLGAIDTDAIARAIARHRDEIKYCYEKEINAENPNLAGRVSVKFVIGGSGIVSTAQVASTTLNNANVEQCVIGVIKRIQFPPIKGGGIAEVTNPFVFKNSNQ